MPPNPAVWSLTNQRVAAIQSPSLRPFVVPADLLARSDLSASIIQPNKSSCRPDLSGLSLHFLKRDNERIFTMSHEIETMAYAGEVPWHGLGEPVTNDMSPADMMKAAGLHWTGIGRFDPGWIRRRYDVQAFSERRPFRVLCTFHRRQVDVSSHCRFAVWREKGLVYGNDQRRLYAGKRRPSS